jgi:hypothetical protein
MATFKIPTNPPYFPSSNFNPQFNTTANTSTQSVQELQAYFLSYPQAQGKETLLDTTITGNLILTSSSTFNASTNLILDSSSNYIQFGDNTKMTTAPSADDPNTVYNDVSNIFTSPTIQTFQGSNTTTTTTAPLQFSNVTSSEFGTIYVDPSPNNDLTIYSNQSTNAGLTVRNPSYSFTVNPTVGNVASFINPISSTYAISGQSFGVNTTGSDAYSIYSNTTPSNYGLVIANTTGNNGSLTLSNNSTTLTTLTSTTNGLTIGDGLDVAGNIGCQAISCSTLNTNGNTISSGTINAGAISGSGLTTTGNITTASNGLGGTSVFNDTVCNFNSISCGGNITAGSFTTSGGINVNNSNINNVNTLNGTSGGTLTLGTQNSTNVQIAGGALTAGSSLGINSANGTCVFNYYTANNLTMNLSANETLLISNSGASIMTFSSSEIDANKNLNMNSNNIINIGSGSTGVTQAVGTNNTTLATTAFVMTNGPIYTTSTFTNNTAVCPNASITPSPCSVISTYIAQTNVANFNNVNFTINVINNPLFVISLCNLVFNVTPFPNSPPNPASGQTTILYNNTNTIYSTQYQWNSSSSLTIQIPVALGTLSSFNGVSFTMNLANLGGFQA